MLKYGQINVTDNFEITYSDINSYITNLVKNFPGAKLNPNNKS